MILFGFRWQLSDSGSGVVVVACIVRTHHQFIIIIVQFAQLTETRRFVVNVLGHRCAQRIQMILPFLLFYAHTETRVHDKRQFNVNSVVIDQSKKKIQYFKIEKVKSRWTKRIPCHVKQKSIVIWIAKMFGDNLSNCRFGTETKENEFREERTKNWYMNTEHGPLHHHITYTGSRHSQTFDANHVALELLLFFLLLFLYLALDSLNFTCSLIIITLNITPSQNKEKFLNSLPG